ncbi:2-oxoacid-dependent dioxygenase [Selaginella moellendorffii]|uniref:2-oxoacid-dependent dioxygenase n=1 Tax=Selaginella moellendorffii TaxID=88036 RepID=D8TDI2_SELML|nr:2-oxoacid-dependent dioxygenase [Selaginella moellendorffii]
MYGKCSSLPDAWSVFHDLVHKNAFSCNIVISTLCANGQSAQAIHLFLALASDSVVRPTHVSFVAAKRVLGLFSESLGLESGALEEAFGGERHAMRMNYYPPCAEPELTIGLDAHADPNGFTILQQDTRVKDGLQIVHCGAWVPIKPLPGAFVVNIGDQLQVACMRFPGFDCVLFRFFPMMRTRVSIASFYGPAEDSHIALLAQLVTDEAPACFKDSVIIDEHKANKSDPTTDFMDTLLEHRRDDQEVVKATLSASRLGYGHPTHFHPSLSHTSVGC